MPRLARSSARWGPTPLIMRTSVVRESGIDASFIPSGQRWRENRNDALNGRDDARNVDRIDFVRSGQPRCCWLTIICSTPVFSDVWQGKELREHFSDVWQRKDLARSVAKAPRTGRGLVGDTPAFRIDVNTKELLAEGFVSS